MFGVHIILWTEQLSPVNVLYNHINTSAGFTAWRATRGPRPPSNDPTSQILILWLFTKTTEYDIISFNDFIYIFLNVDVSLLALAI